MRGNWAAFKFNSAFKLENRFRGSLRRNREVQLGGTLPCNLKNGCPRQEDGIEVRPLIGYERFYYVDSIGRVWSQWTNRYLNARPHKTLGYPMVNLCNGQSQRTAFVHDLIINTFTGQKPTPNHEVRHLNDVKTDNRIENLRWGTRAENVEDARRNGGMLIGSRHPNAIRTEAEVIAILAYPGGTKATADHFNISPSTVCNIRKRRVWRHVNLP